MEYVFSETALKEFALPASTKVLKEGAFSDCLSLTSVTFERGPKLREVGKDAFLGMKIMPILPTKKCSVF
jgi:hypothetical protein